MERRSGSVVTLFSTISLPAHNVNAAATPSSAMTWLSTKLPSTYPPIQQGAAILRDGACIPGIEFDCGFDSFLHACCPSTLTCKRKDAFRCCAPRTNCGSERLCANSSWKLFDNEGYFCCDDDAAGYNVSNHRACLGLGTSVSGAIPLPSLTVDPAATPSLLKLIASSKSSSNAGIVGAILGSIVGFAVIVRVTWIMLRLRRHKGTEILLDTTIGHGEEVAEDMRRSRQFGESCVRHGFSDTPHECNKESAAQPASFELQWSTMQTLEPGRPPLNTRTNMMPGANVQMMPTSP